MPTLSTKPIYTDNPGALPAQYVVPGTLELTLQSIVARFDGSGAGSSFLPVCSIYTQDGRLVTRVRTDTVFAAGDTGVVTFGPFLRRARPPGTILQTYAGEATAADFVFNSVVFVASGFPVNSTFTKLSPTSLLDIAFIVDFTSSATIPNVIFCGVFIDGANEATVGVHSARASSFISAAAAGRRGAGNSSGPPWAAGNHTIEMQVALINGATNATMRCSTSAELTILEYEPD